MTEHTPGPWSVYKTGVRTMAAIEIIYNADEPEEMQETASATVATAADAVRWLVEHLRDWCVDESVRVSVDGEEV